MILPDGFVINITYVAGRLMRLLVNPHMLFNSHSICHIGLENQGATLTAPSSQDAWPLYLDFQHLSNACGQLLGKGTGEGTI